jgi:hypothetical protein
LALNTAIKTLAVLFWVILGRLKTGLRDFVKRKPIAVKPNAKGSLKTVFWVSGCLVV